MILADPPGHISPRILHLIGSLVEELKDLEARIESLTQEIEALAIEDDACQRLMTVPGIGVIISSAVVSAIGPGGDFKQGRDFAAWLGLVPRQLSTGGRTARGSLEARQLLTTNSVRSGCSRRPHQKARSCARSALALDRAGGQTLAHRNLLATAVANKLARIAWAVLAGVMRIGRSPTQDSRNKMLGFTTGMAATPLRHLHSPALMSERRWLRTDGFT